VCGFNEGNNEADGADDGDKEVVASKEIEDERFPPKENCQ
jgi:hypothetical protein